jgi:hypothetical protein
MKKLIDRYRNWLFRRRIRRIEKDAMVFVWAFTDAQADVKVYREYLRQVAHARKKRNRARSKASRSGWTHEERIWGDRAASIRSRYPWGVNLDGENAVLEATFHQLQDFWKKHKHCIIGQYK